MECFAGICQFFVQGVVKISMIWLTAFALTLLKHITAEWLASFMAMMGEEDPFFITGVVFNAPFKEFLILP